MQVVVSENASIVAKAAFVMYSVQGTEAAAAAAIAVWSTIYMYWVYKPYYSAYWRQYDKYKEVSVMRREQQMSDVCDQNAVIDRHMLLAWVSIFGW